MFFGTDENKRYELLLQRRKLVQAGDSKLQPGDLFTHSFNLATGDRSYMDTIWRVLNVSAQKIYAEGVLNVERIEKPDSFLNRVGARHLFDRSEYEFYDASKLHDLIAIEREPKNVVTLYDGNGGESA